MGFDESSESGDIFGEMSARIYQAEDIQVVGNESLEIRFKFDVGQEVGVVEGNTDGVRLNGW